MGCVDGGWTRWGQPSLQPLLGTVLIGLEVLSKPATLQKWNSYSRQVTKFAPGAPGVCLAGSRGRPRT